MSETGGSRWLPYLTAGLACVVVGFTAAVLAGVLEVRRPQQPPQAAAPAKDQENSKNQNGTPQNANNPADASKPPAPFIQQVGVNKEFCKAAGLNATYAKFAGGFIDCWMEVEVTEEDRQAFDARTVGILASPLGQGPLLAASVLVPTKEDVIRLDGKQIREEVLKSAGPNFRKQAPAAIDAAMSGDIVWLRTRAEDELTLIVRYTDKVDGLGTVTRTYHIKDAYEKAQSRLNELLGHAKNPVGGQTIIPFDVVPADRPYEKHVLWTSITAGKIRLCCRMLPPPAPDRK